jgi:putative ABC transport system permease protein
VLNVTLGFIRRRFLGESLAELDETYPTAASQREFATLRAMGIPGWRLKLNVLAQSFWVGLFGIMVAAPITLFLAEGANSLGTNVRLHPWIVIAAAAITMTMAIGSGLAALRSFQSVDPAHNIR